MCDKYILDEKGNPVREPKLMKWAMWMESRRKNKQVVVKRETVRPGAEVSTVFLGLDHNFGGKGPPILWETMVFGGPMNQEQDRCAGSREQAEAMHDAMVERVKAMLALEL